jgi:ferritin-like metal-binding protein YciE
MMPELKTLHKLFEDELRDVYDAERQILTTLPKIINAVLAESLRQALSDHPEETRGQVDRLEQAFESLELKTKGKHCSGMEGILTEERDLLDEKGTEAVVNAAFIAGCQRVEHYEITAYGSLGVGKDAGLLRCPGPAKGRRTGRRGGECEVDGSGRVDHQPPGDPPVTRSMVNSRGSPRDRNAANQL